MSDNAISVRGLRKRFGSVVALDGIDLDVPAGTVLGLLGPNGAGKTTTVRILTTIMRPDAGTATVLGLDVVADAAAVRGRIGLAGQYAAVDENLTGRENLVLVGRLTHQPRSSVRPRADELLERFNLAYAADRPVKTYSGGMRRRLDLAAALVHRPPVLFLDEPTTGLDPRSRTHLWGVIGELVSDGTTLLLTTQYLEEADRLSHRIVVVDDGRIIAEGTSAELKATLGTTIIEVRFDAAGIVDKAASVLSAVGPVESLNDERSLGVSVNDSGKAVVEVVRVLDGAGLDIDRIAVREPTLDDVFLRLTGHAAEAAPGDEEDEEVRA